MAITLTGTGVTYNDGTIQTANSSLQLSANVPDTTGLFSYSWTGIPNTAKRIQIQFYNPTASGGPGQQWVYIYNGSSLGSANGTTNYSSGGGTANLKFTSQSNLLYATNYPSISSGSILDILFSVNNTGTYIYRYNHVGVRGGRITFGNCVMTGGITAITIGSTYSFAALNASLYYEV